MPRSFLGLSEVYRNSLATQTLDIDIDNKTVIDIDIDIDNKTVTLQGSF